MLDFNIEKDIKKFIEEKFPSYRGVIVINSSYASTRVYEVEEDPKDCLEVIAELRSEIDKLEDKIEDLEEELELEG